VSTRAGYSDIITFDMGGTSTDVCLIKGAKPQLSHTRLINGVPLKAAALDVHTVGAGGSSIATIDAGGLLRVGPHSAGARPGPACYGQGGTRPTVTDANVALGRLNPDFLLGGALAIDARRSFAAIEEHVASPRGMSVTEAAASIVAIADTNMAHAVRFVSVERGLDPADFVLVAFGGAGPVHAASVARQLGVAGVLVPPAPGVLCAMGVLVKDLQMDFSRTRLCTEGVPGCAAMVDAAFTDLETRARKAFAHERSGPGGLELARSADVRYVGQNHELTVDVPAGRIDESAVAAIKAHFHAAHREMFGYASEEKRLELVTFRLKAQLPVERHAEEAASAPFHSAQSAAASERKPMARREVWFDEAGGFVDCPIFDRTSLAAGDTLEGPAIVEQMDATTVIPPDFRAEVDRYANLMLRVGD
jgi:N-methylhydantoinase A